MHRDNSLIIEELTLVLSYKVSCGV